MNRRDLMAELFAISTATTPVWGQDGEPRGVDIFDAVCAECHETGRHGAPKIGDRAAWAKRSAQGYARLKQHAHEGIRGMPPKGGDASLSDREVDRAVVYMVNGSGGNWVEASSGWDLAGERSGAEVVSAQCALCHEAGFDSAPRIGDGAAWLPRLRNGMDRLVRTVQRWRCEMPSRGGQPNLTDAEIRSAIIYMATPANRREAGAPGQIRVSK